MIKQGNAFRIIILNQMLSILIFKRCPFLLLGIELLFECLLAERARKMNLQYLSCMGIYWGPILNVLQKCANILIRRHLLDSKDS